MFLLSLLTAALRSAEYFVGAALVRNSKRVPLLFSTLPNCRAAGPTGCSIEWAGAELNARTVVVSRLVWAYSGHDLQHYLQQ